LNVTHISNYRIISSSILNFFCIRAGRSYTTLNISFFFFDGQFYAIHLIILKHFVFKLFIIYQIFNLLFIFNDKSTHDKEKLFQDHVDDQITSKKLKKKWRCTKVQQENWDFTSRERHAKKKKIEERLSAKLICFCTRDSIKETTYKKKRKKKR